MLPVEQVKGIFTHAYMRAYREDIPVPSFLRSFFTTSVYETKTVGIEVERMDEKIAVDVLRGTDGNRNQFSLSTEKQWMPPFFNEYFDATSLDRYDRVFGADPAFTPKTIGYLATDVSRKLIELRKKIERAKELQCAQVFDTGTVVLINGDNINFKRKATSMVDLVGAGGYWSTTTTDIEAQLIAGAEFVRNNGKNGTSEFNLTMSGLAWVALKKTNYFKDNANFQQVKLIDIMMPQKAAFGAGYMGRISAGAYIFNIWTYDEVYKAAGSGGVITRYLPSDTAFMAPVNGTRFELAHAGIPAIIRDTTNAEFSEYIAQQASEYWINNYIDYKAKSHTFEIMSAPLAVPVTVDMIYTMTVLNVENPEIG